MIRRAKSLPWPGGSPGVVAWVEPEVGGDVTGEGLAASLPVTLSGALVAVLVSGIGLASAQNALLIATGTVTPDTTAPTVVNINVGVGGDVVTIACDEDLDEASVSAAGQFTLSGTSATVASVDVLGSVVELSLSGFIESGQTVLCSYALPGSNRIQDVAGNDLAAFSNHAVSNNSTYELVPPEFLNYAIDTSTTGSVRTPNLGAISLQAGDILIATAQNRGAGSAATLSAPAGQGWNEITQFTGSAVGASEYWFWKRWGSGDTDDDTPSFTWSTGGSVNSVAITAWRNCKPTGNPYSITPVKVAHGAAATLTAGNAGSVPPAHTVTLWGFQSIDDNTLNAHTRGTLIFSNNLSTAACMALVYETGVNSSVEECSMTESTNGNDAARVMTLVLEGSVEVADPPFELTLLSTTGYANATTNATSFPQCTIITDPTARSGYIWRYGAWYDRSPTVESRLWLFKQRRPVGDPEGWEAVTVTASTGALNETTSAADGHLSPSLGVDEDGCLVAIWNAHWDEYQYCYWRGTGPGDIAVTLATTKGGITGNALPAGLPADVSYAKLFQMPDGTLCLTGRQGVGGAGTQGLWEADSGTWTEVDDAMIAPPSNSPYMQHVHVNPATGVVHFAFVIAEGQNTTTYRDVCYFTASRAAGPGSAWTFKDVGGTTRTLPITDAAHFVALTTGLNCGLMVHNGLSATAADVPLITIAYAKDGAVDRTDGSNRYLITRQGGAWVRQLIHEVHPAWNLIDGNGSHTDPSSPTGEYSQVSSGDLLYDAATGAVHCVYRSNYQLGSAGIPCVMVQSSFAAPYDTWTEPSILADTPIGDSSPNHDINAWDYLGQATFMTTLIDSADGGQYAGGASSNVYIADCVMPEEEP